MLGAINTCMNRAQGKNERTESSESVLWHDKLPDRARPEPPYPLYNSRNSRFGTGSNNHPRPSDPIYPPSQSQPSGLHDGFRKFTCYTGRRIIHCDKSIRHSNQFSASFCPTDLSSVWNF
ncbi:hypothetical protein J6590_076363 [Homalodisca vitripennis]|nr:hypothetical protein J6590_076363 [Homalodisca vitripennis]